MKNNFAIVGVGNHAKKKIIPSIISGKNKILAVFSSQKHFYKTFDKLDSNLNLIPKKTIFYISSPPHAHYKQSKIIVKNNFSILCEKPSFLNIREFFYIKKILKKNNFFIEIIIYKYSLLFKYFLNIWKLKKKSISKIEINFLIPGFSGSGFRKNIYNWSTCLYDIGIYPISLLNILNIKNYKISIKKIFYNKNKSIKRIVFIIKNNKYEFIINIGEDKIYKNNIILHDKKNEKITFDYFFYGIKKNKEITYNTKKKIIKDRNCFEIILKKNAGYWIKNKSKKLNSIYKNIVLLKKIEKKILRYQSY